LKLMDKKLDALGFFGLNTIGVGQFLGCKDCMHFQILVIKLTWCSDVRYDTEGTHQAF